MHLEEVDRQGADAICSICEVAVREFQQEERLSRVLLQLLLSEHEVLLIKRVVAHDDLGRHEDGLYS